MNNKECVNQLMEDSEIVAFLKAAILAKAERYDLLLKMRDSCSENFIDELLSGCLTENDLCRIFQRYEADEEIKTVERDLRNMSFSLNHFKHGNQQLTDWDKAYEHATQHVKIEDVVRLLTGEENFNRNTKCCFHEDGHASLKVYIKDNFFVCFGCGARGSPIDFVMKYKNCSFREAVLLIYQLT